ncbi:MAG: 50S ribosomal protein L34e [Candidatus Thorarchaeota archaeon]
MQRCQKMPRPGMLTRSRANRTVRTPGGNQVVHRQKFYRGGGKCALTGAKLQLSKKAKHGSLRTASRSAKRPNRPYGGMLSSRALRRGIIKASRD